MINSIPEQTSLSLLDLLKYRAKNQPHKVAYIFLENGETESGTLTYAELDKQASVIASQLQSWKGERALLLYPSGLEFITAFFGCLYAGVVAVPAYPPRRNQKLSRLVSIADDAQAKLALTTSSILTDLERRQEKDEPDLLSDLSWVATDTIEANSQDDKEFLFPSISSDSLAFLQYTSGSTGTPKGVMVTHGNIIHNQQLIQQAFGHGENSNSIGVGWLPLFHDMGLIGHVLQPLYVGFPSILMPPVAFLMKPIRWLKAISKYRATTSGGPNFAYDLCVNKIELEELTDLDLSGWNLAYSGAEPIRAETLRRFNEKFANCGFKHRAFYPCYGMAETTLFTAGGNKNHLPVIKNVKAKDLESNSIKESKSYSEGSREFVGVGRPYLDTTVIVVDPEDRIECESGQVGEIWVSGGSVALGYWNSPESTEATFNAYLKDATEKSFLRTGDLGFVNNGELFITGRLKDVIIIRGRNYYPQDIELTVENSHSALRSSCSAAFSVETGNKQDLVVVCELERTWLRKLNVDEVVREIQIAVVTEHELEVSQIVLLKTGSIFKTSSGKIQRRACKQRFLEDSLNVVGQWQKILKNYPQEYIAPRTPNEEQLANIFAEVLGIEKVGIYDNFFELGGHSLLATQLISRFREVFDLEIPLKVVFSSPTVAQLEPVLTQLRTTNSRSSLPPIQPRETDKEQQLPLSWAQERLWFLNQLEGTSATYNIPAAIHIIGNLKLDAIKQALSEIVRRHEVLRTSFPTVNGTPIQVIDPEATPNIKVVDLRELEATERETVLQQQLQQEAITPFNLEKAPLIRCNLWQLDTTEYVLLVNMHHIVSDGWSMGVLIQELSSLYQAFTQGEPSPLPELSIQYADFTLWQKKWLSGEILETQLKYWEEELDDVPELLQLPTDRPRPSVQTYRGSSQTFSLNNDLTQKLQTLSRESGTTLFMTLEAAFATLLYRYSGQSDILIGSPIANRNRSEIEPLIGFFVNTLVLRTRFEDCPSFESLLAQVKETTLKAYEHQDVPFEQVVEALQPKRSLSYSPLFQVMFLLQNAPMDELELSGMTLSELHPENTIAKFDLSLSMTETDQGLIGSWEYNTDLFDASTIECMVGHFQNLLSAIVENPQEKVSELTLLSEAERHQLLVEWNDTATEYSRDRCIHQLFEEQVEKTPDAIAVVFENQQLTYQQLNQRANQLAHHLQSLGVKPEVMVGICVERSIEMMVGLLGILKAGGAYVPLDPNYPQERLDYMLTDSGVGVLLTQSSLLNALPSHTAQLVCLDNDSGTIEQYSQENVDVGISSDNLAYTIYTSGSTGKPKGVQIQHQTLTNFLESIQQNPGLKSNDTLLSVTTLCFDIAALELYLPLITGACLIVVSQEITKDGMLLSQAIEDHQVSIMQATPATWRLLLTSGWKGNQELKILSGGEALDINIANELLKNSKQVWNLYGPTEATIWSSIAKVDDNLISSSVPIGRPIANTQTYILDKYLQPLPIGVSGELYIGGDGLARGYLNRPELTKQKFISNPFSDLPSERLYKTGDLARYLPDGNIEYLGRIDNQVKIRGFRIELGEIETILNTHPKIQQAVVIVREDNPGNKGLVAYLVNENESLTTNQLREYLQQKLPGYMVPSAFVSLERLPLTPNGKVDRKALPKPEVEIIRERKYVAPRTPDEKQIANIFAEVLEIEKVGIYDSFFELGGHSLLAMRLISQLRKVFKQEIAIREIFTSPTVDQLGQILAHSSETDEKSALPPVKPRKVNCTRLPLSWEQERLWFFDCLEGNSAVYNMPGAIILQGELNVSALERALSEIVSRHEILRTSFTNDLGNPVQIIDSDTHFKLKQINIGQLDKVEKDKKVTELIATEAAKAFDLTKGQLIRCSLLCLSEQEHILLLTMHHIISDGWSVGVLIKELSILYRAFVQRKSSPLVELSIQYGDYALWQREYLKEDVLQKHLDYWRSQLSGLPELLQLPTDRPRPSVQTYQGRTQSISLNKELSWKIKQLSQKTGTTMFMLLQAAFATLLYRYSGQTDIAIGSPVANRNHQEIEPLIGFFVNTLVLRTIIEEESSFEEVLAQVKETTLQAYEYQDTPFGRIIEEIQPQRSLSYSPLFQIMFAMQNTFAEQIKLPGVTSTKLEPENTFAKFDLTLSMIEGEQRLIGEWEYSTDLFDDVTIKRMATHFENLLSSVVENSRQKVSELTLLSEAERHQLLIEWNGTQREYPQDKCIHQLFEEQVEKSPDAVAVVFENQQLTYQELNQKSNQLAHHLQSLGVEPETLVGICIERSIEMIVGLLGILKAGGAYVPLDPHYPAERLDYMLSDSDVEVLLTQASLLKSIPQNREKIVCLDRDWETIKQRDQKNRNTKVKKDNLAYVIYTSGSTGKPKGVMVEHQSLTRLFSATYAWYEFDSQDVWTMFHSYAFDFAVWEIWGALLFGGSLVVVPYQTSLDPESFYQLLIKEKVTILNQTPSSFYQIIQADKTLCNSESKLNLRFVIFGGEVLNLVNLQPWFERDSDCSPQLVNMYGTTETTVHVTYYPLDIVNLNSASSIIGCPIPDLQIYLLDKKLQPVPIGVAGEIYIGGNGLARGYLNQETLTQEKFIPNPFPSTQLERLYKTGDRAKYLPNGNIEYLGRIDSQVKIRGFRIELGEIEAVLEMHSQIQQAVIITKNDSSKSKSLVAYVVTNNRSLKTNQLRRYLKQKLPNYMIPSIFVILEKLPLTPNGKVDRKALPALEAVIIRQQEHIAPRNKTEEIIANVFASVLGLQNIGINDNFFELGGHSLLAVSLMSKIQQHFKINLPLATLFQNPSIEQLASLIASPIEQQNSILVPIKTNKDLPALFCIHPVGGNVLCYADLASHLEQDYSIYGLQSPGLEGLQEPLSSIEDMASEYIKVIESLQPQEPYHILGWSMGGLIAFEMAQQLAAKNKSVASLTLIDSYLANMVSLPSEIDEVIIIDRLAQDLSGIYGRELDISLEDLRKLQAGDRIKYFLQQAQTKKIFPVEIELEQMTHIWRVFKANIMAMYHYQPKIYSGSMILLNASQRSSDIRKDSNQKWNLLVKGDIQNQTIAGNHYTIVKAPKVEYLAEELNNCIQLFSDRKHIDAK